QAAVRFSWLFDEYFPHIPHVERQNLDAVERVREEAIKEVLASGGHGELVKLADTAALPDTVAVATVEVVNTVKEIARLIEDSLGRTERLTIFAQVLSARADVKFEQRWRGQIVTWWSNLRWSSEQLTNLLLGFNDTRSTWDFAASLAAEIEEAYWKRKVSWPLEANGEEMEYAIEKYLSVGRATSALQAIELAPGSASPEKILRILDAGIEELKTSKVTPTSHFVYLLGTVFDNLQQRTGVSRYEIAKREYAYLPLFDYHHRKLTLHEVMAGEPAFYVSLICDAFKPRHGV